MKEDKRSDSQAEPGGRVRTCPVMSKRSDRTAWASSNCGVASADVGVHTSSPLPLPLQSKQMQRQRQTDGVNGLGTCVTPVRLWQLREEEVYGDVGCQGAGAELRWETFMGNVW